MILQTPPMGWNTWNTFGGEINEKVILENVDAFINLGLKDAGYEYIVIDDCWAMQERDPETGKIVPDPKKFPHGMKYIADYIHDKGLKFGMYSCAGTRTCAGFPGSYDHEYLDARTFAEYGCDFLKYDFCYVPSTASAQRLYTRMSMALRECGREILFSTCNAGEDGIHQWARSAGAHMFRSTPDIFDNYQSMKTIALSQENMLSYSAPGCFNDMDMLTVGMFGKGLVGTSGCSARDYYTQFALWCMFSSPLMLGCDIRTLSPEMLALVTNKNLIRINQDPEARPPLVGDTCWAPDTRIFCKYLSNNEYAIGFFNWSDQTAQLRAEVTRFGLDEAEGIAFEAVDAITGEPAGTWSRFACITLEPHECRIYLAKVVHV